MGFDWRTDEDDWQRALEYEAGETADSAPWLRFIPLALVLVAGLLLGGWLISRAAGEQVQETTNDLSGDLLATHDLLTEAALTGDFDLFETFLPANNSYSRQLPLALFRYYHFLDRPFLKLAALEMGSSQEPEVSLSPDLMRAEVTSRQAYVPNGQSSFRPIWLERMTFYRKVELDNRWQLTRWPVDEEFWGETEEMDAGLLRAEFPSRDEEAGRRLAEDIGRLLDEICGDQEMNCPPNFRLKMILVPFGQSLLDMNDNYRTLPLSSGYDAYRIFLPAPTLVGRPVDEAGYQLLYEGYGGWIAAVLVQHYSRVRPVSQAVTADFLAKWGLTPPPLPVLPGPVVEAVEAPPIPFPEEKILLVCQGYSPATWLSYSPKDDWWERVEAPENAPALGRLLLRAGEHSRFAPEGQGSLIRRPFTVGNSQSWQYFLWLGGLTNLLTAETPDLFLAGPLQGNDNQAELLFYTFDGQDNPYLANTADCLAGDCQLERLAGVPVWSPSGERSLLTMRDEAGQADIYLGDGQGQPVRALTAGYGPQWVDEEAFIFVGRGGSGLFEGRFDGAGELEQIELLADVARFFSPQVFSEPDHSAAITYLGLHPAQEKWVVIGISLSNQEPDKMLLYNRQTRQLHFGFAQSNLRFSQPFVFSDDGRFLTIPVFENGNLSGGWQILVFDLEKVGLDWQYPTTTAYFDWSGDSRWLLIAEADALRLIAPEEGYERRVSYELGCHAVGWWGGIK